jgi:hypothetical protein
MTKDHGIAEPPPAAELIRLVAAFLLRDVVPVISDAKLRYRVRAAENLLRLAQREMTCDGDLVRDENGFLITSEMQQTFGTLDRLSDRLCDGTLDIASADVLPLLERYVIEKLRIAAPDAAPPEIPESRKG